MERVKEAEAGRHREIRIGTSPLTPPALLASLWPRIQPVIPDLSFRLVPFENDPRQAAQILESCK